MVVDEHLRGGGGNEECLHILDTAGRVEVEAEHKVGNLEEHVALLGMLIVSHDLLRVRQPLQEVGVLVGHDDDGLFFACTQIFRPGQTRADGVAIWTLVAGDEDRIGRGNQLVQLTELRFVQNGDVHVFLFTVYGLQFTGDLLASPSSPPCIVGKPFQPSNVFICKP